MERMYCWWKTRRIFHRRRLLITRHGRTSHHCRRYSLLHWSPLRSTIPACQGRPSCRRKRGGTQSTDRRGLRCSDPLFVSHTAAHGQLVVARCGALSDRLGDVWTGPGEDTPLVILTAFWSFLLPGLFVPLHFGAIPLQWSYIVVWFNGRDLCRN